MKIKFIKTLLAISFFILLSTSLQAQIPKLISYQGFLTNTSGEVLDNGAYNITVKIFDAETGGTELWSENHSVSLIGGLFNVALGSNTPLNLSFDRPYFVSTTVDGTELLPRTAMTASPYALNAPNNGQGQGGSAKAYALDAEDGSKVDVVLVDSEGQVGIGDHPGVMPDAFTYIFADEPARIGLQTDIIYNPSTRMATGIYAQSSLGSLFEEDDDLAKGMQVNMLGENAFIHTGVFGVANGALNGYGFWGRALDNDQNTGVYGEAFGGETSTGISGISGNGALNYAIKGANFGTGWAGYFQGNGYFGSPSSTAPPTDNRSAQLLVDGQFNNIGILASSNDIGARLEGGNQALIAESTTETGFAGLFNGKMLVQDAASSTEGAEQVIMTTALKNTVLSLRNTLNSDEDNFGMQSIAAGLNGIGGRFQGSKLGGRFIGQTGLEAIAASPNDYSGVFYGDLKVLRSDPSLPETIGTIIQPEKINLIQKAPAILETVLEPGKIELIEDVDNDVRVRINAPFISIRGNSLASQVPRLILYDQGINYTLSGSTEGLSFSGGRTTFDRSNGITINNQATGFDTDLNAYGLNINGGTHGLAIKLDERTNSDNNFISFMDDSQAFPFQGSIVGSSDVSDIGELLVDFFKDILAPDPSVEKEQSVDVFESFNKTMADPDSNTEGAADVNKANTGDFATIVNAFGGDRILNAEFLINQIMMRIDVLDASFTFVSSLLSVFDPEDIWATGVSLATSIVNLGIYTGYELLLVGVSYETASGDYAEYLIRQDSNELITYGDIVGVRTGEISKQFFEADHFMVVSKAPAMSGAAPQPQIRHLYEKVAFMGQVPVKVMGVVNKGDYIIPSGNGDGLGIAINPKKMRPKDYHRIVGIAWQESDGKAPFRMINTAVGINQNDLANIVDEMQTVMNEMQLALKRLDPEYQVSLFNTDSSKPQASQASSDYSVAPTHPSKVDHLFSGMTFETQEEAIAAVTQAWKKVANIDIEEEQFEIMRTILDHPEQAPQVAANYAKRIQSLQEIVQDLQTYIKENK
ncbi:MAG: hypothetical protein Sapg2KO_39270 [Saprospiraceae bacterium]